MWDFPAVPDYQRVIPNHHTRLGIFKLVIYIYICYVYIYVMYIYMLCIYIYMGYPQSCSIKNRWITLNIIEIGFPWNKPSSSWVPSMAIGYPRAPQWPPAARYCRTRDYVSSDPWRRVTACDVESIYTTHYFVNMYMYKYVYKYM